MKLDGGDQARLDELTEEHRQTELIVSQVQAGDYIAPEFDLAIQPREYQRIAADLAMKTGRLLIADDVGLGKTCDAICTFTDPSNLPALVVTLAHLPKQWAREIEKFAPKLRTHVIKKGTVYDICKGRRGEKLMFPDVIVINYHKLGGWAETLAGVVKTVVYDEVQELRRTESLKYAAAEHVSEGATLRIGLSATPIFNYGGEIYSVLSAIEPGCLGQRDEFMREWCDSYMADRPKIRDPKAFGSYLREQGLMIRRTRSEVGRELEPLTKIVQAVEADTEALSKIEDSAAELAKIILSQNTLKKGVKMHAAEELSNIVRQATGIAKAPYVADFVRMLAEADEPVLLYCWHREVYSILNAKLADLGPVMYTGSESPNQKQAAKEAFLNGESKILMMSLRAGAGLDGLQFKCRTVVFGELDWSPGVHEQCIGRVHRDGQTDPVMAYFLLSDYGSDPVMLDVLGVKKSQSQGIRDPNADLIETAQASIPDVKRLAESFLKQRGLEIQEPSNLSNIIQLKIPIPNGQPTTD
jgi:SNF2 family DNA or RNA helicase